MSPAIALLPDRALIRVEGPDWRPFLHNLLTHDIEALEVGRLRYAALLTPQGRLLHDLFVLAEQTGSLLDVAATARAPLIKRLTLYKLRAKVTIEPAEGAVHAAWSTSPSPEPASLSRELALAGEDSREAAGGGRPAEGGGADAASWPPLSASPTSPPAARERDAGLHAPDAAWSPDPRLPDLGSRSLAYTGPTTAAHDAYDAHRLTLGVPDPALDARETDYPLELDLDLLNAIDFKKGCFIGQETTSRMKRRGAIKTRAVPIAFEGPPPPFGTEILAGDLRAGEVRSGRDGRAMAVIRLDRAVEGALAATDRPVRLDPPPWLASLLGLTSYLFT